MHILILTIEYPPIGGGASPQVHELTKKYVTLGHQVSVVTMGMNDIPATENVDGIIIHRIKCRRNHRHISFFYQHLIWLWNTRGFCKKYLREHAIDVVHAHFLVPTGILAMWLKKKYRIPYIITTHGSDVPGYNPDRFSWLHRFTPSLVRQIIRHSTRVVCPSLYLKGLIQLTWQGDPDKLVHIPTGIDLDAYQPGNKKPIILSTGRLLPRKGFQYLIRALADVKTGFEIHICGDGPMMNELKKSAAKSLTPIVFHGWIDNKSQKYKNLLAEASIYSLVSEKENASTSLVEALAAGCAVITSDISGCPESVEDAGICIAPANVKVLRDTLLRLIQDNDYREQKMAQSRQLAIEKYDWTRSAINHLALVDHKA